MSSTTAFKFLMEKINKKDLDKINLLLREDITRHLSSGFDSKNRSYDFLKKCFDDNNDHFDRDDGDDSIQSHLISDCQPTASSDLGDFLLKELLNPTYSDVNIKVKDENFFCHRSVLSARSDYFSAMLSARWRNSSVQQELVLHDVKESAFAVLLCYLYGATSLLSGHCLTSDLIHISDMFGTKCVTSVIELSLSSKFCHGFKYKPCKECISHYPDVIKLASTYSLSQLYTNCIKWNCMYFTKLWPTHKFAALPKEIQTNCVQAVISALTVCNAVHLLMGTDVLLSNLTRLRWTIPVISMGTEVMTSCIGFLTAHFLEVTENKTIFVLFEGMGWKTDIVQQILTRLVDDLAIDNVCSAHLAIRTLTYHAEKDCWIKEFTVMLQDLKNKIMDYLISNYYAVIHTESWHLLNPNDKTFIKTQTMCVGDETRKLSKRPVLTSSLNKPKRMVVALSNHSKNVKEKQKRLLHWSVTYGLRAKYEGTWLADKFELTFFNAINKNEMAAKPQKAKNTSILNNTQCIESGGELSSNNDILTVPPMITMSSTQEIVWVKTFEDVNLVSGPMSCN